MAQHAEVHARLLQVAAVDGWVPGRPDAAGVASRTTRAGSPSPDPTPEGSRSSAATEGSGLPGVASEDLVESTEGAALGTFHARALASATAAYTAAHGHVLEADALTDRPGRRWATQGRVAAVAAAALVLVGAVVVVRAVQQAPSVILPVAGDGVAAPSSTPAPAGLEVVVHVVGRVTAPGLVHLPAGSRVADALDAAGGATPEADLAAVNLARVLTDGEQIVVPRPGEQPAGADDGGRAAPDALDLNTAGTGELDTLPGVGPVIAQRIVDWRTDHGSFSSIEELGEVSGIGPSLLDGVRDLVRVG